MRDYKVPYAGLDLKKCLGFRVQTLKGSVEGGLGWRPELHEGRLHSALTGNSPYRCFRGVGLWIPLQGLRSIIPTYTLIRWTPHPVIVTLRDNKDYIRVLLYSYYTTITGSGVLLTYTPINRLYVHFSIPFEHQ